MIQYSLLFLLLMISARASFFYNLRIFSVILFFASLSYFLFRGKRIDKKLIIIDSIAIIWIIAIYIKFDISILNQDSLYTYLGLIILLNTTYFIIICIDDLFVKLTNIILFLSIISIFGFLCQLIMPKITFELNSLITNTFPFLSYGGNEYSNSILFTFYPKHAYRNSGFSWEPGAFGAFLDIMLGISLILSNYKFNYKHLILIICVITTFSVTAYAGILIIIVYYLFNINFKKSLILIIILFPIIFYVIQLNIIGGKIEQYFTSDIVKLDEGLGTKGLSYSYSTNRFASFILDIWDLKSDPILGRGINDETRYYGHSNIKRSNGLSDFMLRFGLVLFVLFTIGIYKSTKIIVNNNNKKRASILIILIFTVAFAEPILYTPYVFLISFYYLKS